MIKINLEKELLNTNIRLIEKNDSLLLNEYEKQKELDIDILTRIGLNNTIDKGLKLENKIKLNDLQLEKFDKTKIFNKKQIEKICNKYYLKFLEASYYSGTIDKELPNKIVEFEDTFNVICSKGRSFILAPKSSFLLEEKPKDPLFFYKINEENYYLIHKWGDDLNIFNRIKSVLSKPIPTLILFLVFLCFIFIIFNDIFIRFLITLISSVSFFVGNMKSIYENDTFLTLYKKNDPFTYYK
jgi:hypothetical protein